MKKFKLADMWISIALITISLVYGLFAKEWHFIIGYFVVGGWQVVSMLIHAGSGWFTRKGSKRYRYHLVVLALAAATGLSFLLQLNITILLVAVFPAFCFTVYGSLLCLALL